MLVPPEVWQSGTTLQIFLQLSVKLPGQALAATSVPGQHTSRLFYIKDRLSGFKFLVDTGAAVSVIPLLRQNAHMNLAYLLKLLITPPSRHTVPVLSLWTLASGVRFAVPLC